MNQYSCYLLYSELYSIDNLTISTYVYRFYEVNIEGLNYWTEKIISKISHVEEFGCNKVIYLTDTADKKLAQIITLDGQSVLL